MSRDVPGEMLSTDVWKLRFFSFWSGQSISLFGSALTQFVLAWWIALETGSASSLATAGIAAMLPQGMLGPIAGVIADRYSRRLIMIVTDLISALSMAVLVVLFASGGVELWHIYLLMAVRSAMQAFQGPAAAASVSMLVPQHFLSRAAGLNQLVFGLMSVVAAPVAALALAFMPIEWALSIDVFTAVFGIVPLLIFRIPQYHVERELRLGMWSDMRAGLSIITRHRGLATLYGLNIVILITIMPAFTLIPLLVEEYFKRGINGIAMIETGGGLGMIVGGLAISMITPRRPIIIVLVGNAIACVTVAFVALTPAPMLWLAVVWWFVSGAAYAIGTAPMRAILQTVVPNQYQGRVLSLFMMIWAAAGPIGLVIFGPLSDVVGLRLVFLIGGVISTAACLVGFASRSVLGLDSEKVAVPEQHDDTGPGLIPEKSSPA